MQWDVRDPKSIEAAVDQLVEVAGLPDVRRYRSETVLSEKWYASLF